MRPIGVGEALRGIIEKVIMMVFKKDIKDAAISLPISAGQDTGAKAAIHAMQVMHTSANEDTKAVLLINAENAFSSINRKVMRHSFNFICPINTMHIIDCFITAARLSIIGGEEILCKEIKILGDATAVKRTH